VALQTIDAIAAQALRSGIGEVLSGPGAQPFGGLLSGAVGALLGLPGRATGGPVAPGRGYLVGERGPEVFVPTSAGRVEPGAAADRAPREVRVSIQLAAPRGTAAPVALQRSSRQVASAVRRALREF
jgi:phage-related minor tail protein